MVASGEMTANAGLVDEWRRAGLYDAGGGRGAERLELLVHLHRLGATTSEMVDADRRGQLSSLGSEVLRRGPRWSAQETADRFGLRVDRVVRMARAAGLPIDDKDEPLFREKDVEALRVFAAGVEMFGEPAALQLTRVVSGAMAAITDAAMAMFGEAIAARLNETDATELERAHEVEAACELLFGQLPLGLETVFFHQAEAAIRRAIASGVDEGAPVLHMAVGFLDLVGSTALVLDLAPREFGKLVSDFEQHACELVASHGGRVVKTIGDEVMFVCPDPVSACHVALAMCEYAASEPTMPALRGALAFGDVVAAYGDFYGYTVNLAARAVKLAPPGSVLVNRSLAEQIDEHTRLSTRSVNSHELRGFPGATELFSVQRN